MWSYKLGASVVLNGLFLTLGILVRPPPCAAASLQAMDGKPAATSAAADAWMNSRRCRYTLFGVISDERMPGAFLISIGRL